MPLQVVLKRWFYHSLRRKGSI